MIELRDVRTVSRLWNAAAASDQWRQSEQKRCAFVSRQNCSELAALLVAGGIDCSRLKRLYRKRPVADGGAVCRRRTLTSIDIEVIIKGPTFKATSNASCWF